MNKSVCLIIGVLFIVFLLGCRKYGPAFEGTPFVKNESPESVGYDPAKLKELRTYLKDSSLTTGMVVLQGGKMIFEYGDTRDVSYLASVRKSIVSMLYGKYVDNGTIDLNQEIGELGIDEKDGLLPIEKIVTVDHIITARSGVFHEPANGGYDEGNVLPRGSVKPGEYFLYNNWDFNVAGYILENATGKSVYQELEEQLAIPLGFQDWNIKNQRLSANKRKSRYPAYHMFISTRDIAKIGQLMLNKGKWNGEQLISANWIEKTTTEKTPPEVINERYGTPKPGDMQLSYSYMWWLIDNFRNNDIYEGAYSATGFGGQFITVIPKLDMVIAHKTKLKLLVKLGLKGGDVPEWQYWIIMDKVVNAQKNSTK